MTMDEAWEEMKKYRTTYFFNKSAFDKCLKVMGRNSETGEYDIPVRVIKVFPGIGHAIVMSPIEEKLLMVRTCDLCIEGGKQ